MVTRTHTTGRIRNPFEITVRHSTHSNARMRAPPHTHEGERGAWCVHSPLGCATHAKMFGKLLPLLLAIKSPFLAIFVVCVCVCLQLTNCQVATHFNSIPTTQLLPRLRAPLPLTRKVTRKYNRLFLHFLFPPPFFGSFIVQRVKEMCCT